MNFFFRLRSLLRRRALEDEMAEEMRFHLEQRTAENVGDGLSPEEARYAAHRRFGGVEQIKERARDERGWIWLEQLRRDARFAVRSLRKTPGFTAVALLTLALGIGATTTLYSVIEATLLHPLPFSQADRLAVIWETNVPQGVRREGPSGPNFYDWREQSRSFQDLAAVELGSGTVTGVGEPQQVPAMRVTTNLFSVLQVRPALGRLFAPEDGVGGRQARVIVSDDFWRHALGADPQIVGKTVTIDLISYQVIGVLAADFALPFQSDLFVPWPEAELRFQRGRLAHDLGVIGRLQPGVTSAQAEGELNVIAARLRAAHPELAGWSVSVVPLQTVAAEYLRPALVALFCAVTLILLMACTNVASLLLARSTVRAREMAVRAALGASRGTLARQCLVESLVLGLAAGALGTLLAVWAVLLLPAVLPHAVPVPDAAAEVTLRAFRIDGRVLAFSLFISVLTSAGFGLAPAVQAFRTNLIDCLKKGGRGATGGGRLREAFLVAEVALALVVLAATGLTLQSFRRLQRADLGFRPDHLLTLEMELPTDSRYRTAREQGAFFARVVERAAALPGVTSAAVTTILPLHNQDDRTRFLIENGPPLPPNERLQADLRKVSPDYFATMGIALRRGRLLDRRDDAAEAPLVGLVDETFVRHFFGAENPLGRHLLLGPARLEIVGVVGAAKHAGVDRDARPTLYFSFRQRPAPRMDLVMRTAADPGPLTAAAKAAIWEIDPDEPIYRVETMESVVAEATSAPRLTTGLLGVFALVALGLAALGVYGVTAYFVAQRSSEIGIRMALGARPAEVQSLVLGHGMRRVAFGLLLGLGGAWGVTRLMGSILYEISPGDPLTLIGMTLVLAAVALVSSWLPARRATKVDPLVALRAE